MNIPFTKHTLANGLDVLLHEDHSCPIVAVNIWYHVGSKNETPGHTGFAHLFEHLMFEGSEHHDSGFFQPLQAAGAALNGSTSADRTNYWEVVPSSALELALWMESDRMGYLLPGADAAEVLEPARRRAERAPAELREPARTAWRRWRCWRRSFRRIIRTTGRRSAKWPICRPRISTRFSSSSGATTIRRTRRLSLAGDIDPDAALALVRAYFEPIEAGALVEPVRAAASLDAERRIRLEDRVELPRLYIAWLTPPMFEPTATRISISRRICWPTARRRGSIAGSCTTSGSRPMCPRRRTRARSPASCSSRRRRRPATRSPSSNASIIEEIARLAAEGPTADELERGRVQARRRSSCLRLQTVGGFGGKSDQLNAYNVLLGDPDYFERDLARYQQATAPIAAGGRSAVPRTRPAHHDERRSARAGRSRDPGFDAGDRLVSTPPIAVVDRSRLPGPRSVPRFAFPAVEKSTLANGLRVWSARHNGVPLVGFLLIVRRGAADDPPGQEGLAAMTADMLDEGTGAWSAIEVHQELARIGAQFDIDIGADATLLGLTALSRFAGQRPRTAGRRRRAAHARRGGLRPRPAAAAEPPDPAA